MVDPWRAVEHSSGEAGTRVCPDVHNPLPLPGPRRTSIDRLGRNTRDLFDLVDEIAGKSAAAEFLKERITVDKNGSSPLDALMLGIMTSFAEFERNLIRERQAEDIALAKAKGKYTQTPKLSAEEIAQAQIMVELGLPKTQIAATFNVSRQTLYTALKEATPSAAGQVPAS
jgi:DNA invertase Pin-like site-specific DNA recombinase